jgi:hypothetical protein
MEESLSPLSFVINITDRFQILSKSSMKVDFIEWDENFFWLICPRQIFSWTFLIINEVCYSIEVFSTTCTVFDRVFSANGTAVEPMMPNHRLLVYKICAPCNKILVSIYPTRSVSYCYPRADQNQY